MLYDRWGWLFYRYSNKNQTGNTKYFFREICKLKLPTTEMNQQNQSYYISSQFTEVNFQAFLLSLTVYIDKDRKDHSTQVEPGMAPG